MTTVSHDPLLEARVPRYTSYPTANHFHEGVTGTDKDIWLGRLPDEPVSLYVHIPFCHALCWYCACTTGVARGHRTFDAYVDDLVAEIRRTGETIGRRLPVSTLHFGGGTPTVLGPDHIDRIMDAFAKGFRMSDDMEVAVETDPRVLDEEPVSALARHGLNRVSLGIQDFAAAVQAAINRYQSVRQTADAVALFRAYGVEGVNFDLVYGLPHQTVESAAETVEHCLAMRPSRVAVFGYAHVPWFSRSQRMIDERTLPEPEARKRLALSIGQGFRNAGMEPIGLDHFASPRDSLHRALKSRCLRRNFQGYTTDSAETLIGFGVSAISRFAQGYTQNATEVPKYRSILAAGRLPVDRGIIFNREDLRMRDIIEALMCYLHADLGDIARAHGFTPAILKSALERLQPLIERGIVIQSGDRLTVPETARMYVRSVCSAFDQYYNPRTRRHAPAI